MGPGILNNDLLRWTLITSLVFHLFIVLGISFVMPDPSQRSVFGPPLKITLISDPSEFKPLDTEVLAQANSLGDEQVPSELVAQALSEENKENLSKNAQNLEESDHFLDDVLGDSPMANNESFQPPEVSRDQLKQDINLAYLNAQSVPREKYVSSRTRESKYAAYIEKWRLLVERVGNLNYPEAAKEQQLEGSLVLDAAILANGEVGKVRILQSSGSKLLDDAAARIVHIAAPFDRFPDDIAADVDTLHIVRTWEFGRGRIVSRNFGEN